MMSIKIERKATWAQQSWLWGMAILAILIDQYTKNRITITLPEKYMSRHPIEAWSDIFQYIHVHNTGAAFSMLEGYGWFFTTVAFGVVAFLLFYNYTTRGDHLVLRIALGSVMGGALGNVIDRIRLGYVIDFIHFNLRPLVANYPALDFQILNWPVFNWADIFVVSGVVTLATLMVMDKIPEEEEIFTRSTNPQPVPVPSSYQYPAPVSYPAQVVYSGSASNSGTTAESADQTLPRFALWAIIVGIILLLITAAVILFAWQRNRSRNQQRNN